MPAVLLVKPALFFAKNLTSGGSCGSGRPLIFLQQFSHSVSVQHGVVGSYINHCTTRTQTANERTHSSCRARPLPTSTLCVLFSSWWQPLPYCGALTAQAQIISWPSGSATKKKKKNRNSELSNANKRCVVCLDCKSATTTTHAVYWSACCHPPPTPQTTYIPAHTHVHGLHAFALVGRLANSFARPHCIMCGMCTGCG